MINKMEDIERKLAREKAGGYELYDEDSEVGLSQLKLHYAPTTSSVFQ